LSFFSLTGFSFFSLAGLAAGGADGAVPSTATVGTAFSFAASACAVGWDGSQNPHCHVDGLCSAAQQCQPVPTRPQLAAGLTIAVLLAMNAKVGAEVVMAGTPSWDAARVGARRALKSTPENPRVGVPCGALYASPVRRSVRRVGGHAHQASSATLIQQKQ
jgi:hypothetical protein